MVDEKKTFEDVTQTYKTYGKRWLVLSVVVILNLSGAMVWLTFTPVAYKAATYYGVGLDVINWLSLVFNFSGIFFGAVATYVLEAYGLRPALYLSGGLTFIGAAVRIASVAESLPDEGKVALLFVGQVLVAIGQPFSMYAPAKTAASWFPEHQRALANTIGAVANPIGVVIAGLISPLFVNYDNGDFYVMNLLITMTAPTALAALMVVFVMTTGNPPTPPSAGSNTEEEYFGSGVKKILRNKNYMLLVLTVGGGVGLYSAFATLLEQLLCPYGYTDSMAGICSAVLTGCGVIGAAIVGIYCDYSKQFSTTLKASYVCVVIGIIIFCVVFHINMGYLILILIAGIGLFSFGIYPIGVELGVEATYPVGVATSSGLIMMSGQIQAIVLVLILQVIGRPMSPEEVIKYDSKCHTVIGSDTTTAASTFLTSTYSDLMTTGGSETLTTYDMSLSIYVCAAYMGLLCIVLLAFFRPIYNRMAAEQDGRDLTSSYENVIPSKYNEKSVISNL